MHYGPQFFIAGTFGGRHGGDVCDYLGSRPWFTRDMRPRRRHAWWRRAKCFVLARVKRSNGICRLCNDVRALVPRSSDAEDLSQDCMLRALPHLGDIDDLRAYLFQTLRNAYADRISLLLRESRAVTLEDADFQLIDRRSPLLRLDVRDVARQVAKLPREQQQVRPAGQSFMQVQELPAP